MRLHQYLNLLGDKHVRFRARVERVAGRLASLDWGRRIIENLEIDPEIEDRHRLKLARRLCCPSRMASKWLERRFQMFCYAHQRLGTPIDRSDRLVFGHVQGRRRLSEQLADHAKSGVVAPTRERAVSAFCRLSLAAQKRRLGPDFKLSEHQMFSTYDPDKPGDPFHAVLCTTKELVRRLALPPLAPGDRLLHWSHRLPARKQAHIPTTFDGELLLGFRPGGFTTPEDGSPGLPEAIHEEVTAALLETRIEEAP